MVLIKHSTFLIKRLLPCTRMLSTTASKLQEQKVIINGQTINYLKVGNGSHSVLCFPGALGTIWSDFKPQIETLNRDAFTVVAWDPPGYGRSQPPKRTFPIDFYERDADQAYAFMKHLHINKFSLLGWSDGGISSMIMAAKYPSAIQNLIIWGSNSYIIKEELEACESLRDLSKWSDKMKAPLIELYGEKGLEDMWNSWCDVYQRLYEERAGDICKGKLSEIVCPTLILHGDKDPMCAAEHPGYLNANIRGSKLHRFPDGKHNVHLRYAEEFNSVVTDFILGRNKL